jgi:predicted dehydrogenase
MPTNVALRHLLDRRQLLVTGGAALAGCVIPHVHACAEAQSSGRIKIGQIGVGHAHANKLAAYRRNPDYEVVGIVEPDEKLRQSALSQEVYRDLPWLARDQLLATPGLQAVLVETRVRDLLANAEACIAAGKHIHLDKPAGESLDHYRKILAQAERQKLLVQMGYMFRYNPAMVLLRSFLKNGWLGEVFEVHAVMSKLLSKGARAPLGEYPGGIMFELGCHVVDQVISILGKPTAIRAFPRQTVGGDKLLDNMLAVFEYPRATATVKSSVIEVDGGERRHLTVCGTKGTFHIQPLDNPRARVTLDQPRDQYRKGYQDVTFPRYERYVDDAVDMARIIRGEKSSDFSYEHDLIVQGSVLKASGLDV